MPFFASFREKPTSPSDVIKPFPKLAQKISQTLSIPIQTESARENCSACDTLFLRTAQIQSTFQHIIPCTFNQRPATLITVDMRLIYQNHALPKKVKFIITFSAPPSVKSNHWYSGWLNNVRKPLRLSAPEITNTFGPKELSGDPERIINEYNAGFDMRGPPGTPGFFAGGKRTREKKFCWHVQGKNGVSGGGCTSGVKNDNCQRYSWDIRANELDSMEVMPRRLNLWMVVMDGENQGGAFRAQITVEGRLKGLRGFFSKKKIVVGRRDFKAFKRGKRPVLNKDKLDVLLERGDKSRVSDATDAELRSCLVK